MIHQHPYPPFIPEGATKLIIGTLPPPRFSIGELHEKDVDFCYGSRFGLLWPVLDSLFELNLLYENSTAAVEQRKQFLIDQHIGICDMVERCERSKIDASDLGMTDVILRNLIETLHRHKSINTLLFTGGNTKNGPEYFFRRHLKDSGYRLTPSGESGRVHLLNLEGRSIRCVSLLSPSSAANRAIGSNPLYKQLKAADPMFTPFDFRLLLYREHFLDE